MNRLLFLGLGLLAAGCNAGKQKMREQFMTSCLSEAARSVPDAGARPIIDRYCNCSADKIIATFSAKDLERIMEGGQPAYEREITPVVAPCMSTFTTEIEAYYKANPADAAQMPAAQ